MKHVESCSFLSFRGWQSAGSTVRPELFSKKLCAGGLEGLWIDERKTNPSLKDRQRHNGCLKGFFVSNTQSPESSGSVVLSLVFMKNYDEWWGKVSNVWATFAVIVEHAGNALPSCGTNMEGLLHCSPEGVTLWQCLIGYCFYSVLISSVCISHVSTLMVLLWCSYLVWPPRGGRAHQAGHWMQPVFYKCILVSYFLCKITRWYKTQWSQLGIAIKQIYWILYLLYYLSTTSHCHCLVYTVYTINLWLFQMPFLWCWFFLFPFKIRFFSCEGEAAAGKKQLEKSFQTTFFSSVSVSTNLWAMKIVWLS